MYELYENVGYKVIQSRKLASELPVTSLTPLLLTLHNVSVICNQCFCYL
jgi:hypothetical protein